MLDVHFYTSRSRPCKTCAGIADLMPYVDGSAVTMRTIAGAPTDHQETAHVTKGQWGQKQRPAPSAASFRPISRPFNPTPDDRFSPRVAQHRAIASATT
jgi:hypothetical protein